MTTNRRLLDVMLRFDPPPYTGPACAKCHRPDCGLLATVIIGERNWYQAVGECIGAKRLRGHLRRAQAAGEEI